MSRSDLKPIDIQFKNVTKKYHLCANDLHRLLLILCPWIKRGQKNVLQDVNFTIRRGEKIAFIGSNGAGKTTTMKLITGSTIASSGEIIIKRKISSIIEITSGLEGEFSGLENIYIRGTILGFSKKEVSSHLDEIIDFANADRNYISQELKRYSAGMVAKLAISIALHLEPQILIVDEALSVGDIQFNKNVRDKIHELSQKEDLTLLLISHNEETVHDLCDRVILIDNGEIKFDGPTAEGMKAYHKMLGVTTDVEQTVSKHTEKK